MRIAPWLLVLGCGGGGQTPHPDGGPGPNDPHQLVVEVPLTINRNLDVLLVIDNSLGMDEHQRNFADNFPNFVNVLDTVPGGLPDLHLGVINTDMGTSNSGGAPAAGVGTVGQGGCAATGSGGDLQLGTATGVTDPFVSDIKLSDGTRQKNYNADLSQTVGSMVKLGATGCGFEQPLAATKAALSGNSANAGFLRQGAHLAVIFLTDEDDCSIHDAAMFGPDSATLGAQQSFRCTRFGVTCSNGGATTDAMNQVGAKDGCGSSSISTEVDDVTTFHDFLAGLKSGSEHVVVGGIIGTPTPVAVELRSPGGNAAPIPALAHSCTFESITGTVFADPGVRLQALFDQFPDRSASGTICQQDLTTPLDDIAQAIKFAIGSPCLSKSPADADPNTAGLQLDCIVQQINGSTVVEIPQCATPGADNCWETIADVAACPGLDHLALQVNQSVAPPPDTVFEMRCLVEQP